MSGIDFSPDLSTSRVNAKWNSFSELIHHAKLICNVFQCVLLCIIV